MKEEPQKERGKVRPFAEVNWKCKKPECPKRAKTLSGEILTKNGCKIPIATPTAKTGEHDWAEVVESWICEYCHIIEEVTSGDESPPDKTNCPAGGDHKWK